MLVTVNICLSLPPDAKVDSCGLSSLSKSFYLCVLKGYIAYVNLNGVYAVIISVLSVKTVEKLSYTCTNIAL